MKAIAAIIPLMKTPNRVREERRARSSMGISIGGSREGLARTSGSDGTLGVMLMSASSTLRRGAQDDPFAQSIDREGQQKQDQSRVHEYRHIRLGGDLRELVG